MTELDMNTLVRKLVSRARDRNAGEDCPDIEAIAAYADGRLKGSELSSIESHLISCDACLEDAIITKGLIAEQYATEKEKSSFDVVIDFIKDVAEVIKGAADVEFLPAPEPVAVRANSVMVPNSVSFRKFLKEYIIEVVVEKIMEGMGQISICILRNNNYIDNIRVSLFSGDKEIASFLTDRGCVLFEDVRFDRYRIHVGSRSMAIGDITLRVKEA
ncbi:MAG: zf-HC2 domain-containing protein [Nitrospirota bacterium]|nr:MAG: zf-HC2 domain-containing protein [Nitrospirota bacterium]